MKSRTKKTPVPKELLKRVTETSDLVAEVTKYIWLKWADITFESELSLQKSGNKFNVMYSRNNIGEFKCVKTGTLTQCLDFIIDRWVGEKRYSK